MLLLLNIDTSFLTLKEYGSSNNTKAVVIFVIFIVSKIVKLFIAQVVGIKEIYLPNFYFFE